MSEAKFPTSDRLAFERTRLAYERTMMAWTRTSTALITFGFGMYKLFEVVPFVHGSKPGEHAISPRAFALVLASGNMYSGLWYPVIIALGTFIIGSLFLRETKDVDITK